VSNKKNQTFDITTQAKGQSPMCTYVAS